MDSLPFGKKKMGLLYISNKEATITDLSAGRFIRFEHLKVIMPSKRRAIIVYNITNV